MQLPSAALCRNCLLLKGDRASCSRLYVHDTAKTSWLAVMTGSLPAKSQEGCANAGVICSHGSFSNMSRVCRREGDPRLIMHSHQR